MCAVPISIQLYTVREEIAAADFPTLLKTIADAGYVGVEFAGLHGLSPAEVKTILDDLGLQASSSHGGIPWADNVNEIIDTAKTLGYTRHIAGKGQDDFATEDGIRKAAEEFQAGAEALKGSGITLGYHNHWWEFENVFDGKTGHAIFMDQAPDVFAQIDTYWVEVGKQNAESTVKALGNRAPILHIKDGSKIQEDNMVAVGSGAMEWTWLNDVQDQVEWLVVELDRCGTDMIEAVKGSQAFLTAEGYARGK